MDRFDRFFLRRRKPQICSFTSSSCRFSSRNLWNSATPRCAFAKMTGSEKVSVVDLLSTFHKKRKLWSSDFHVARQTSSRQLPTRSCYAVVVRFLFIMLAVRTAGLAQTCGSVTLSSYSYDVPIEGMSSNRIVTINVIGNCLRPAATPDSWISIPSGGESDSRGPGSFQFFVSKNLAGPTRTGHIYIVGVQL